MEREEYDETRRRENIEDKIFVIFGIFLKQSEKERKLMFTNDSTSSDSCLTCILDHH